jgi:NAD(P)-dependent dehydrogenase (short-subunit alcohol dehydrogenase family)
MEEMAHSKVGRDKVLIVGGGSGMGLALAKRCLDVGSSVVIVGRMRRSCGAPRKSSENRSRWPQSRLISRRKAGWSIFRRTGRLDHIVSTAADIEGAYELLPALKLEAAQRGVPESKPSSAIRSGSSRTLQDTPSRLTLH